jgi:hypothetical protein
MKKFWKWIKVTPESYDEILILKEIWELKYDMKMSVGVFISAWVSDQLRKIDENINK